MSMIKKLVCAFLWLSLFACSEKFNAVSETVSLAVKGYSDYELTAQEVISIPYPSVYVRVGDGPQLFMVMGYAENNVLKWISADSGMIVTRNGRITKTIGLPDINLDGLTSDLPDPLTYNLQLKTSPIAWNFISDFSPGFDYGHVYHSQIEYVGSETLLILDKEVSTDKYQETVVDASGQEFVNLFWVDSDSDSGDVIQAWQQFSADSPVIKITMLKRYKP